MEKWKEGRWVLKRGSGRIVITDLPLFANFGVGWLGVLCGRRNIAMLLPFYPLTPKELFILLKMKYKTIIVYFKMISYFFFILNNQTTSSIEFQNRIYHF